MKEKETVKSFNSLVNKRLIGIEYCDKSNSDDSCLKLLFSDSFVLSIFTFWRFMNKHKILAMDSDRYILPDYNAPEKDYDKLPLDKSLLYKNLEFVKTKYINSIVEEVTISNTNDIILKFKKALVLLGFINCRCNLYKYYELSFGNQENLNLVLDWRLN